jgi:tyrosine-specific transport protein
MTTKKFLSTAFTLTGTIIGAGILGLPYVFSQSGFLIGLLWIFFFGFIITLTMLYLSEVSLRTKGTHQLPGLAEKHLGKAGRNIMIFAMMFGLYASLLAYLIGEGESLSQLLQSLIGTPDLSFVLTLLFWLTMTILLSGGIERLRRIESYGVLAVVIIIFGVFIYYLPSIQFSNLTQVNPQKLFLPLGVTMFALLGFTSIPELREEIRGSEKKLKNAIILGASIPIILYIIFTASFVGVLGESVTQIATLSFGPFIIVLGIFTMLTSYFVLSFSIKDMCKYDLNLGNKWIFFWTSLLPLFFFIILYFLELNNFIQIIGIGGVISGGLVGILAVIMNYKSKKQKGRKPEFSIYINKPIALALILIFIVGIILQIYYSM